MSYKLFLDDERCPGDVTWVEMESGPFVVVRDYQEFISTIIQEGIPDYVTFDHDLADMHYQVGDMENQNSDPYTTFVLDTDSETQGLNVTFNYGPEKTGYDCAKWLVNHCVNRHVCFPRFNVHSLNPVGSKRISDYIQNAINVGFVKGSKNEI